MIAGDGGVGGDGSGGSGGSGDGDDGVQRMMIGREVRSSFNCEEGGKKYIAVFPGVVTGWSPGTQEYTVDYADPDDAEPWYLSERNLQFHLDMDVESLNRFLSIATEEGLTAMVEHHHVPVQNWLRRKWEAKERFSHTLQVHEGLKECFLRLMDSQRDLCADLAVRAIRNQLLLCDGERFATGLQEAAYDWVQCETCKKWRLLHKCSFERLRHSAQFAPRRHAATERQVSEPCYVTCAILSNEVLSSEATREAESETARRAYLTPSKSSCQHPAFMDKSYTFFDRSRYSDDCRSRALCQYVEEMECALCQISLIILPAQGMVGMATWSQLVGHFCDEQSEGRLDVV